MKRNNGALAAAVRDTLRGSALPAAGLVLCILGAALLALLPPLVLERIVDALTAGSPVTAGAAFLYFGALAAAGILQAAQDAGIAVFGQKLTRGLRERMCAKLDRLPASYFTAGEAGRTASRFTNDADALDALFTDGIVGMFADGCTVLGIAAVVFGKSPGLGALLLLVTPPLFLMTRAFQKRALRAQTENRAAVARVTGHVPETIRCIRTIRAFFREDYMERRYAGYLDESYRAVEKANLVDSVYSPIVVTASSAVIAAVMVLASAGGGFRGFFGMTAGTAAAVIAYVGRIFSPLESIGMEIQSIQSAAAGLKRIDEFLGEPERKPRDGALTCGALRASAAPRIEFRDVTFGYGDEPVLEHFSFSLAAGERATLAGRTGSGKSTVLRLLLGLWSPDSGAVTVCGAPADAIPDGEKRRLFGVVEQTFRPVPGTVADQIALFDGTVTRAQAEDAARLAGLHEAILALPRGYDTPMRDGLFSQGQLQLLSIARAAAPDPAILLLDEIAANLDSGTEARVEEALALASASRTVLSVSHRLDQRVLAGRIIGIG